MRIPSMKIQPTYFAIIGSGVCCLSLAWMYLDIPGIDGKKLYSSASSASPPTYTVASSSAANTGPSPAFDKATNLAITSSFIFQSLIWLVICLFSQPPGSLVPSLSTSPPTHHQGTAAVKYSITRHVLGRLWRISPIYDILEAIIIWNYRCRGNTLGKWKREKTALLALYYLRIRGVGEMSQEMRKINRDRILEWKRANQLAFGDLMGVYGEPKWFSAADVFVMLKVVTVSLRLVYLKGWNPSVLLVKLLGAAYVSSFVIVKLLEVGAILWVDDGEISHVQMEQEEDELRCWLEILFTPAQNPATQHAEEEWEETGNGTKTPTGEKIEKEDKQAELTPPSTPPTVAIPAPFEDFTSSSESVPPLVCERKPTSTPPSSSPPPPTVVYKRDIQGRRVYPLPTPDTLESPPSQFLRTVFQTFVTIQNHAILPVWIIGYWNIPQFSSISFFTAAEVLTVTALITLLSSTIVHVITEMLLPPVWEKGKNMQLAGLKNRIGWLPSLLSDVFLKGHVDYHTANLQYYLTWFLKFAGVLGMMCGGLNRAGVSFPELLAASWKIGKPLLAYPIIKYAYMRNRYLGVLGANFALLALLAGRFHEVGTCGVKGWFPIVGGYREGWTEWIL